MNLINATIVTTADKTPNTNPEAAVPLITTTGSLARSPKPGFTFLLIATAASIIPSKPSKYPAAGNAIFTLLENLSLNFNTTTVNKITLSNANTKPTAPKAVIPLPATVEMLLPLKTEEPNDFDIYVIKSPINK
ncbi:hypothetical protein MBOVb_5580 [Mycoplasmopsis bovis 1067]|nr:hypothetical protein MBOVb_5580 [Mycoplasmopsis bovis 1067]